MKKVRLSLAALTLVLAIAGTTMANKVNKPSEELCIDKDPKGIICVGGSDNYCCTDDKGPRFYP
jgi:hypothetical protein